MAAQRRSRYAFLVQAFRFTREQYWLTRFVILRLLGFIYVMAFLAAVNQLGPLIGTDGLTPIKSFLQRCVENAGSPFDAFWQNPSIFWFNSSDTMLHIVPWIGLILSCAVAAGFANSIMMAILWVLYLSIVHVGQDWYSFGWEIQLCETGFLAIFLVPLLDARPFPARAAPYAVIVLFRVMVWKIMLGAGLIKLRGDDWWRDLTALNYFFETQPIPNPLSVHLHLMPHWFLATGVVFMFIVELVVPWFTFWPRPGRIASGLLMIGLQVILIIGGNFSFLNWLTIVPALACFDDRFLSWLFRGRLAAQAAWAQANEKLSIYMEGASYAVAALVGVFTIFVVVNLISPRQAMIQSYEPFYLVNSYGVFGTVTQNPGWKTRRQIVFEGTLSADPATATDWKEYTWLAQPSDPAKAPIEIAPYQPHLDWQLWFVPMEPVQYMPWLFSLDYKLLHNDPGALSLIGPNPFPGTPPRYVRVREYIYHFAPPGNPQHVYWTRELAGTLIPPMSGDDPQLNEIARTMDLLPSPN